MTEPLTFAKVQRDLKRETENVVNRLHRHCRIVNVIEKVQIFGGQMVVPPWNVRPDRRQA